MRVEGDMKIENVWEYMERAEITCDDVVANCSTHNEYLEFGWKLAHEQNRVRDKCREGDMMVLKEWINHNNVQELIEEFSTHLVVIAPEVHSLIKEYFRSNPDEQEELVRLFGGSLRRWKDRAELKDIRRVDGEII